MVLSFAFLFLLIMVVEYYNSMYCFCSTTALSTEMTSQMILRCFYYVTIVSAMLLLQ